MLAEENAAGISASALATFARDLSGFGSRREKAEERRPAL